MNRIATAILAGVMFGFGLGISGVANPVVINNFLDLAGDHLDFTLLILFAVAVTSATVLFQSVIRLREHPVFDTEFHFPSLKEPDRRLILGATIFGVGWSLSGYCIGPALASFGGAPFIALMYTVATIAGVLVHDVATKVIGKKKGVAP